MRDVRLTAGHARLISSICVEAEVLGHRADVVIDHAARALAAYRRQGSPSREDIYDAATLWDVFEHLRNPAEIMARLAGVLRPGGFLLLETANWHCWERVAAGDSWAIPA